VHQKRAKSDPLRDKRGKRENPEKAGIPKSANHPLRPSNDDESREGDARHPRKSSTGQGGLKKRKRLTAVRTYLQPSAKNTGKENTLRGKRKI